MGDIKSVTVQYLRELARKHLGRGHSKLKTKQQLLAALIKIVPGLAKLAGVEPAVGEGRGQVRDRGVKKVPAPAAHRVEEPPAAAGPEDTSQRSVEVVSFPPKSRGPRSTAAEPGAAAETPPPQPTSDEATASPAAQHPAEPLVEGFFVARVAGEQEVWRHHLTESQAPRPREARGAPAYDEALGELPDQYEDDTALLLPRDPHTLFVLWDFQPNTRARALAGLEAPRAVLRVHDDESMVREVDFALESRCFYIHELPSGRPYWVSAHFVGRDGRSRRIGHSTNRAFLPPEGVSQDTSVRFMRMPAVTSTGASMETVAATAPTRAASFEEREYITWRRVALPGSAGFEDVPEVTRERTAPGAPGEGSAPPSAPSYLDVSPRPPGASEQTSWTPPPSGRGR